jgi:hypothetical protein
MAEKKSARKSEQSSEAPTCKLILCEDPKTGEVIVKPDGPCPDGYVRKMRDRCQEEGITFLVPKIKTREEE